MGEDLEEENKWLRKHLATAIAALGNHLERIQKLEDSLREIAELGFWDGDRACIIAKQALEKEHDRRGT